MCEAMALEIERVTDRLLMNPNLPEDERNYTRGVLFAARNLLRLPDRLIDREETEARLNGPKEGSR